MIKANSLENLKYPIGLAKIPNLITEKNISDWIEVIKEFPTNLESFVNSLTENLLDTSYRKNVCTIRQVIHHCADIHLNS